MNVNIKVARVLLISLLVFLIVMVAIPFIRVGEYSSRETVIQETLQCVSAVCVEDKRSGKACTFVGPQISKVLITVDPEDTRKRIVRVEPTNAECR